MKLRSLMEDIGADIKALEAQLEPLHAQQHELEKKKKALQVKIDAINKRLDTLIDRQQAQKAGLKPKQNKPYTGGGAFRGAPGKGWVDPNKRKEQW